MLYIRFIHLLETFKIVRALFIFLTFTILIGYKINTTYNITKYILVQYFFINLESIKCLLHKLFI